MYLNVFFIKLMYVFKCVHFTCSHWCINNLRKNVKNKRGFIRGVMHARTRQQREQSRINDLGVAVSSILSGMVSFWIMDKKRDAAPPKGYGRWSVIYLNHMSY